MQTTHRLLNGEAVRIDVPDAVDLPGGTSLGVLALEGAGEMQVTAGSPADLSFFLQITGTALDREVALRGGRMLRHGRYAADPAQGVGWAIDVGEHQLFGFTLPTVDLESLTGFLTDVDVQADPLGAVLTPGGRVTWSPYRTLSIAQVVELPPPAEGGGSEGYGYLLDSRRARTGGLDGDRPGVPVRGGRLTRSGEQERHRYGVLESRDFVTYGLPGEDEAVDLVLTSLSEVLVELAP
ncbi:hypothetical protein [Ornithinimicrobium pratense]|uniref:Uncharacterized protein n=1 Tax=Ornithinimicrobium pratense TaxID=2593973 RepID=A0A5J6V1G4_9MICO|nr:hypothetical protein [Ornithinimicrobium pratense]QFG67415.1 hypothetical protein FY030_00575 [Ornithinimicrobium pratense]